MKALERVVSALGKAVTLRRQDGVQAKCPVHADGKASLAVKQGDQGVVMKCHAGCDNADVVKALGLKLSDLFDEPMKKAERRIVATYDYKDEQGKLLYQVVRFDPKDFRQRRPLNGGWEWNLKDTALVPYHLPELLRSAPKAVFIVEGEKDVHALESLGLVATTNAGGAGKWRLRYNATLKGRDVFVLPDNDEPGRKHANEVLSTLGEAKSARIVELPGLPPKGDVSDWVTMGGTREQLLALCKGNPVKDRIAKIRKELDELERSLG